MKTLSLAGLSILALVSTACAQDNGRVVLRDQSEDLVTVRRELEAVFAQRMEAVKNKDAEAQIAQVAPDYSATLPDGQTMNYEQIVGYMRGGAEQFVTVLDASITIEGLMVEGNEAIVDARQRIIRTQRLADGNIHHVETGVLQREIWVKTADGWRIRSVDELRDRKVLVDGEPVDPDAP